MKWVRIFQVGVFWVGTFQGGVSWVGIFLGGIFLEPSLTKFNKLNKRRKRIFLITQFKNKKNIKAWFLISEIPFTLPFQHILNSSSAGRFIDISHNFFDQKSKCALYIVTYIFKVVASIFCVFAEWESKKMWSNFANVTLA